MSEFAVALFHTTSAAMRADKTLRKAGLECRLVPTPRQLTSDCGIAVRFAVEDEGPVVAALEQAGVEVVQVAHL